MPTTSERANLFLREAMAFLAEKGTAHRQDVIEHLAVACEPTSDESAVNPKNGRVDWQLRLLWNSTGLTKSGFVTKDNKGNWTATAEGKQALLDFQSPAAFGSEVHKRYRVWANAHKSSVRRAWLVRGASVLGANLVPDWLSESYCSLAASHLRPLEDDISPSQLAELAQQDYVHLKHWELKAKVTEIVDFVTRIHEDDVVVTTNNGQVFVGTIEGDWAYQTSEGGKSNLTRPVQWKNPRSPVDFTELPAQLQARLKGGETLLDITNDLALVENLQFPDEIEIIDPEVIDNPPHEHLGEPSPELAEELLCDPKWLSGLRALLDERRQIVLYGPPGTGKTYVAQKLAADLVGVEQVKLVQFHPAYTYEDFFEGFRPTTGDGDGSIHFELRAGPFRRLVERAREHPDQAFVLIIDEINRANLAKVFGELYFLLEYRDQAVDLLYSSDEQGFTLPKNVYLIGTMNTADRSIALIDAAMRRRFAFVALDPDTEPTKSLLRKWSKELGLGTLAADVLDALNQRIDDPDLRIGPSYFMTSTAEDAHSLSRLERIWDTSILPLLQEHYYGQWANEKKRFAFKSMLPATEVVSDEEVDVEQTEEP